jgi:hypothetical protein
MPAWVWAAIIGAVATLAAAGRSWWRGRELRHTRAQLERVELERDAAGGRAATSEAQAEVLADHVDRQASADAVEKELRDAIAAAPGDDHLAERAALYERLRTHQGDPGPVPGTRPPARVPDGAAAEAGPRRRPR